jgi:hypothetical protein
MHQFDGSDGSALLPLIDEYLDRPDLNASRIGGGSGPSSCQPHGSVDDGARDGQPVPPFPVLTQLSLFSSPSV